MVGVCIPLAVWLSIMPLNKAEADQAPMSAEKPKSSIALIEKAYQAGEIPLGDKVFNNLLAVAAPKTLPDVFQSEKTGVEKSGTPYIFEAVRHWDQMTPEQQVVARTFFYRPVLDSIYISPSGYFKIHYSHKWPDSVSTVDDDLSGVSDYVERVGLYADSAYAHYQGTLGYLKPPADADGLYDIYLVNMGHDEYGRTWLESGGDSSWSDYRTYMEINCDLSNVSHQNQDPEGTLVGALKVVCAHEYFHATQCAYDSFEDLWWMECTAVAYEDVLFPEVKDNLQFAPLFFDRADTSLTAGPLRCYGAFVWPEFLMKQFGSGVIKEVFEYTRFYGIISSLDSALKYHSSSMAKAYPHFAAWNYFTDMRADTALYRNSPELPAMPIDRWVALCPFQGVTPNAAPDAFGCNYVVTYPDLNANNGLLKIDFDGGSTAVWGLSYMVFRGDSATIVPSVFVDTEGRSIAGIYDYHVYDSIVFVPAVVSRFYSNHQYEFGASIHPFGDTDGNGVRNLLDVLVLISRVYQGGSNPYYDWRMGDLDCSGSLNLVDILWLIDLVYYNGEEPTACRY